MKLTYINIPKLFIISLFLLFLCPSYYMHANQKSVLVEELLDQLQKADTNYEAEIIRKKIWNKWIYEVPKNQKKNLEHALNEFFLGKLLSAEKAFTNLITISPLLNAPETPVIVADGSVGAALESSESKTAYNL